MYVLHIYTMWYGLLTVRSMPRHRWENNIRMDLKEIVSIRGIGLIRLRIGIMEEM